MVNQSITTPEELFHFNLRSTLQMEQHSLQALEEFAGAALSKKIQKMYKHHTEETNEQIENLSEVFRLMDFNESTAPSQSTTGILNQGSSLLERTAKELHDQVTLMSALGNEHYEISRYQGLIVQAHDLGATNTIKLLQSNLDQEIHTSEELYEMLQKL